MVAHVAYLGSLIILMMACFILCERTHAGIPDKSPPELYLLYKEALQHDPEIAAAKAARDAGKEAMPQARAGLLPQLSVAAEQEWFKRRTGGIEGLAPEQRDDYSRQVISANLSQPVFDLEAWYRYRTGQSRFVAAGAEFLIARQALGQRLIDAYFRALRQQSMLAARKAELDALIRQRERLDKQLNVGLVSKVDLLEVMAEESRVTVELVKTRQGHREALKDLESMSGIVIDRVATLSSIPPRFLDVGLEDLLVKARSSSPRLILARQRVVTAKHALAEANAAHGPVVSLEMFANRELSDSPDAVPRGAGKLEADTAGVALRLDIPIYAGGRVNSRGRERRSQLTQAEEEFRLERTRVINELESGFDALHSAEQSVSAARQAVRAQKLALSAAEKGLKAGVRDVVDVLRARRESFRAVDVLNDARYELINILVRIYRLTGQLDADRIRRINQWLDPS